MGNQKPRGGKGSNQYGPKGRSVQQDGPPTADMAADTSPSGFALDQDPFDTGPSEWDYRAPTLAEQVSHAQDSWDGPRCPHGQAQLPYGPDIICGACESEMAEEEMFRKDVAHHEETGRWMHPIGPSLTARQQRQVRADNPDLFPPSDDAGDLPF